MIEFIGKMLKSKTIIVNVLTVIVGTLGFLGGHEVIAQNPEVVAVLAAVAGGVNVVLRLITSIPISEK